jgi:hypothetical protein
VVGLRPKGAVEGTYFEGVRGKLESYQKEFHARHGDDSNLYEEDLNDVMVITVGQGILDGSIKTTITLS